MVSTRSRGVIAGIATIASTGLAFGLGMPAANAAQANTYTSAVSQVAAVAKVQNLASQLGDASGGYFFDQNGHMVVNVLDSGAAQRVSDAGFTPRTVKYNMASLVATKAAMDKVKGVPQTAWGLDTSHDQVVVTILNTATPATAKKVTAAANKFGDKVRIERRKGHNELYIRGGDAIQNDQARCSLGFNVTKGGQNYMLTAGHCTNLGGSWSGGDVHNGTVTESDCPGADSGLITNPDGTAPGQVNTGQAITSAATPTVGQQITKSGSTTGVTSGSVNSVDQSVNFDVGTLNHMTGTNVHSDHGDSGGTGFTGSAGQGTLSGGDTTTTYFYPLNRELSAYGVSLA
jgi:streptogrisin D